MLIVVVMYSFYTLVLSFLNEFCKVKNRMRKKRENRKKGGTFDLIPRSWTQLYSVTQQRGRHNNNAAAFFGWKINLNV